jgi:hypothetical protein
MAEYFAAFAYADGLVTARHNEAFASKLSIEINGDLNIIILLTAHVETFFKN